MTPAAQAFYDACCAGKEWDVLAALSFDVPVGESFLADTIRPLATSYDPYTWRVIQPQIDKEIASLREGVRDHYAWRNAFGH